MYSDKMSEHGDWKKGNRKLLHAQRVNPVFVTGMRRVIIS